MHHPNGDVYTGEWVKGKAEGKGVYQYNDKTIYSGEFKEGEMEG